MSIAAGGGNEVRRPADPGALWIFRSWPGPNRRRVPGSLKILAGVNDVEARGPAEHRTPPSGLAGHAIVPAIAIHAQIGARCSARTIVMTEPSKALEQRIAADERQHRKRQHDRPDVSVQHFKQQVAAKNTPANTSIAANTNPGDKRPAAESPYKPCEDFFDQAPHRAADSTPSRRCGQ